eukprot:Nk52_evm15s1400 gene=Nk52_evmTU15s1400
MAPSHSRPSQPKHESHPPRKDYSRISEPIEEILEFPIPSGVCVTFLKAITPNFKRQFSMGTAGIPKYLGFDVQSTPLPPPNAMFGYFHSDRSKSGRPSRNSSVYPHYHFTGLMYDDGNVESLCDISLNEQWRAVAATVTCPPPSFSHTKQQSHTPSSADSNSSNTASVTTGGDSSFSNSLSTTQSSSSSGTGKHHGGYGDSFEGPSKNANSSSSTGAASSGGVMGRDGNAHGSGSKGTGSSGESSYLNGFVQYCSPTTSMKLMYMTDENMIGINGLYSISRRWSVGGEVLFSISQKAPGLSFGAVHENSDMWGKETLFTCIFSPIPGHLATSYMARIGECTAMATRYEYNVHSRISHFSVGTVFQSEASPFRVHVGFDTSNGLSLLLSGFFRRIAVSVGANCSFQGGVPRESVGCEISFT